MEVALFLVVGIIAIAAAVLMLLSENAVHSALFLIVNFACVAFFYLMLDAPFLAMVQIAVYAGAIMVLFLFVIMLLGAEKLTVPTRHFRWLAPVALALAAAFLLITGVAVMQGQINLSEPAPRAPEVRVVNAAPDAGTVMLMVNGEPASDNVPFGESSAFQTLTDEITEIRVESASGETVAVPSEGLLPAADATQTRNTYTLIVTQGDTGLSLTPVIENLESTEARAGRITVFNAFSEPVDLVDFGLPNETRDDVVMVDDLAPGTWVELPAVSETTLYNSWAFTQSDGTTPLYTLSDAELFKVERDTEQLLVLAGERLFDGEIRPVALPLVSRATPIFGGPQAIGELLFTTFMLPFQLIAVLLLAAMIGAIVLTHKEGAVPRRRDVRRVVSKPLAAAVAAQTGADLSAEAETEVPQLPPEGQPEPGGD